MKSIDKIIVVLIVCSVIFGAMPVSGYAKEKKVSNFPGPDTYAPGEVIVKLKSGSSDAEISKIISKYNAKTAKQILKDNKKRDKLAEKSLKKFGIERIYILEVSESSDINKLVDKLNKNPDVEYAEPNYIVHIDTNPNDPFFSNLWGLHNTGQTGGTVDADIDAPEAWEIQTGSSDVVIAVIDSGVDYLHPDLEGNIWTNPGETPDDGLDNDNNGYTDDVHGYDFVSDDGAPLDGYGHGTHVAGTIGAVGNNDLGIVGVNWNVAIMPIRFLGNTGSGTTTDAVSSIIYAIDNGADILSNSWGGGSYSSAMKDTISAANDAGILFVAAAGNAGSNNDDSPHYPSSYYVPNVVAVAATDNNDGKPSFSNYGLKSVDLGAPGAIIYSTVPTEGGSLSDPSGYKNLSGTSMATPHVAGVAGLIKAQFPQYSSDEIKARLLESVDNIPSLNGITVTGGRLNAKNSLTIAPLSVLFYDDMETAGGWTHSGSGDNWESGTPLSGPESAKSGTNVWATKLNGNYATDNMDAGLTSPSIDLSTVSSAKLTFYHHYDMESTTDASIGYDGGILEASNNGGISWTRITPVGGYLTDISTRYSNPLGGGSAYSHYSGAEWHYAVFDMSNYAGSSDVKIQFRFATDSSINNYPGWYIDDVTVLGELIEPNIAPVALDDSYNVNEDTTLAPAIGVLDNDTDADNDVLSAILVDGPSNGALTLISNGSFTYIPAANFNGPDSFTYKAKNSKDAESSPATVTITVNPINDAPVAQNDSYSVNKDTSLDVPATGVLSNDNDVDDEALSAVLVTGPSNGNLTLNSNGSFTYTPFTDFNGPDSFTYKANDGIVNSDIATVKILVNAINNVPVALDDSYNVNEDTHLEVSAATGVLDNDTDANNDALSAVLVADPSNGILTLNSNGSFTYIPAANFNGADSFTYKANDGMEDSDIATVTITINPVNDVPVALDDSYSVNEDTSLDVPATGVLSNDTDTDNDALSAVLVADPSNGTLTLNSNGSFNYIPAANFNGADSFTYNANDGMEDSNIATVTITVNPVNDVPVALDDSYSVNQDTSLDIPATGVLSNDTDTDNDALSAVLVADPSNGTLTLNSNGSFTYTPITDFNGLDSFTYKANDGIVNSNTAIVKITVNAINSVSVAVLFYDDMETTGGWTHSGSGDNWESGIPLSGPESAKSGTNVWATKLNGDYAINNMDARLTSPSIDLSTVSSANLTFYHHYDMESTTDGSIGYDGGILEASNNGGISWTRITPVGGYPSDISTRYSNPLGGESAYSHYSGTEWHYAVFDMSNYAGSSDVKIQFRFATDSSINNYPGWYIDDVTVLGELIEPNIAPVALDDSYNVNEDTTLAPAAGVLDNDTDADNDVLSAVLVAGPSNGALTLNSDGSFTYIPAANFNGADSFNYKAKDSKNAESSPATVTITVNPVNDIPVALDDSYSINEDTSLDVPAATGVLGNDNDVDGEALSAVLVAGPSNGTLILNSNGSFTYTPFTDLNGPDSFTYKAKDSNNAESSPATVTITEQSTEVVEFFDSFEYGYSNWVQDSQNDWRTYTQRSTNGTYSAEVDGWAQDAKLTMANGVDLSGKTDAILSFSWFIESNWDNGEYIKLEISTDGITWTELASINGNGNSENQWVHEEIDLSEYMTGNVKIQFKARVSSSREDGNVDNVRIVSIA